MIGAIMRLGFPLAISSPTDFVHFWCRFALAMERHISKKVSPHCRAIWFWNAYLSFCKADPKWIGKEGKRSQVISIWGKRSTFRGGIESFDITLLTCE